MKKVKKAISLAVLMIVAVGCKSTTSNSISPTVSNNQTNSTSSNCKLYPYKSAIIKYKQKDKVLIWDDWGVKTYESRHKNSDIIMINNGLEYRINHNQKKITKMRNMVMDWLIVANKDLRAYYVATEADDALIKTGEHEKVAGKSCNIWINSVPSPSTRYCLYNDLILLKKETYDWQSSKKWRIVKEAYEAKFNTAIDNKLFTKIPNYPTRDMTKYTTEEVHKLLKETPESYRNSLEVANKVKTRGERHRESIRDHSVQDKRMLEVYLSHRIANRKK